MTNVTHRIRAAHPRRPLLPLTLCAAVMMVMPQLVQAQWSYLDCGSICARPIAMCSDNQSCLASGGVSAPCEPGFCPGTLALTGIIPCVCPAGNVEYPPVCQNGSCNLVSCKRLKIVDPADPVLRRLLSSSAHSAIAEAQAAPEGTSHRKDQQAPASPATTAPGASPRRRSDTPVHDVRRDKPSVVD